MITTVDGDAARSGRALPVRLRRAAARRSGLSFAPISDCMRPVMRTHLLARGALGLLALAGCSSSSSPGSSGAAPPASGSAAVAAAEELPILKAIGKGSWRDSKTGAGTKLEERELDGCYGFKNHLMKVPQGSVFKTLQGARACWITFPGEGPAEKHIQVAVISDELPPPRVRKESLQHVTAKPYETADAYVYEVDDGKKKDFRSEWEGKFGPRTLYCSAFNGDYDFETHRGVLELCRTLRKR